MQINGLEPMRFELFIFPIFDKKYSRLYSTNYLIVMPLHVFI
jgi:hypothetical protein